MKEVARRRPSPALVISFIALAVAITGTASALEGRNQVRSDDIAPNAVKSPDIANDAVRSLDIAGNAVKSPEIAAGAVGNEDLASALANETLTSGSRVTMTLGEPTRVLLDNATFRLVADCFDNGLGLISIETTQAGSAYAAEHFSGDMGDHTKFMQTSFGPGTPADPEERVITAVLEGGGGLINLSMFAAEAPNGASLSGIASASNIGAPCAFTAFGVS